MKKLVLFSLAGCLLCLFSCQETEITPEPEEDSDTYDLVSFDKVAAGTLLSSVTSDEGLVIPMTSFNSLSPDKPVAAIVFNSNQPHWEDKDLGTPNQKFNGQGIGAGGESGNFLNNTALDNIVVLQNFRQFGTVPNDDDGPGYITFDFSSVKGGIQATSLTVIDVETAREKETGNVQLYASKGGKLLHTATFPDTEANGVGIIDLKNISGVGYIVVNINGSIAIDNLRFSQSTRARKQCTYTHGYWKKHPERWLVNALKLGTLTYTKEQVVTILRTSAKDNGLISLAHQLIAAKLNIANGSSDTAIAADIIAADALIGNKNILTSSVPISRTCDLADKLKRYNEGKIGPGNCD